MTANPIAVLFFALFPVSLPAQILQEDFSGAIPPAGWSQVQTNPSSQGWIAGVDSFTGAHAGWAWHEDEFIGTCDALLVSPAMDLSLASGTFLSFAAETKYSAYLANHPNSLGDGISNLEITTDGGLTWAVVWTDTSQVDGGYSDCVDLSAWDGMSGVQVGIRYFGTFAQEWWVDSLTVDQGGCSGSVFGLRVTDLNTGQHASARVRGATPGGSVLFLYSFRGAGPTSSHFGDLSLSLPIYSLPLQTADSSGRAEVFGNVPYRVGTHTLYAQAVDLASGVLSNAVAQPVL